MNNPFVLDLRPAWEAAVALGLGALVGIEREHARIENAPSASTGKGVRSFSLITLLGYAAALLGETVPGIPLLVILALGALLSAGHLRSRLPAASTISPLPHGDRPEPASDEISTDAAALLMLVLGMLVRSALGVAVLLSLLCALILISKPWLKRFAASLRRAEFTGTLQLLLAFLILLPLVPSRPLPLPSPLDDVINPRSIVLFVLLIAAVGYAGYVLTRLFGAQRGLGLAGLVGGLTSSTAVTLAMAERARSQPALVAHAAQAALLACAVMMARIVLITAIVFRPLGLRLLWPALAMAAGYLVAGILLVRRKSTESTMAQEATTAVPLSNPFELGPAFKFGLLYVVVLVLSKIARTYLGVRGFLLAAAVAGLADVDSITIAAARLTSTGNEPLYVGVGAIWVAIASNTLVKATLAWISGGSDYGRRVAGGHGLALVLGAAVLAVLWFLTKS